MGSEIDSIRIAAIQIPFIPIAIVPDLSTISEPEGNVNFWIIGEKMRPSTTFNSLIQSNNIKVKIPQKFATDYLEWLALAVKSILDYIVTYECPDIILFPEYSLPVSDPNLEGTTKLINIIMEYSTERYIIGGSGVISNKLDEKYNKFFIAHNGEFLFGNKKTPNKDEAILVDPGDGPFIYNLKFKNGHELLCCITMCSDALDFCTPPSTIGSLICRELKGKFSIDDFDKKFGGDYIEQNNNGDMKEDTLINFAIDLILIPSCTEKVTDFKMISSLQSGRKYRPTIFSNSSFFGGTKIWGVPYDGIEYYEMEMDNSGVIIADIPVPPGKYFPFPINPKSVSARDKRIEKYMKDNLVKSVINTKKYYIVFNGDDCYDESSLDDQFLIKIEAIDFLDFINKRINQALVYMVMMLLKYSINEDGIRKMNQAITSINLWKALQLGINGKAIQLGIKSKTSLGNRLDHRRMETSEYLPEEFLVPYLEDFIFESGKKQYELILSNLDAITSSKYKGLIEDLRKDISAREDGEDLYPFHITNIMNYEER